MSMVDGAPGDWRRPLDHDTPGTTIAATLVGVWQQEGAATLSRHVILYVSEWALLLPCSTYIN